jgi:non-homologous end joining protein Ku
METEKKTFPFHDTGNVDKTVGLPVNLSRKTNEHERNFWTLKSNKNKRVITEYVEKKSIPSSSVRKHSMHKTTKEVS